ncbi:MAG: hypothetical protein NXI32_11960 [bacterium]|nr:hypothetical protein [bacterium]
MAWQHFQNIKLGVFLENGTGTFWATIELLPLGEICSITVMALCWMVP